MHEFYLGQHVRVATQESEYHGQSGTIIAVVTDQEYLIRFTTDDAQPRVLSIRSWDLVSEESELSK